MAGWGTGAWGTSPWGAQSSPPSPPTSGIAQAYAIAIRTVLVQLAVPPLANNSTVTGDALNPNTWGVERLDTNEELTVLLVTPAGDGVTFFLSTLQVLGDVHTAHDVFCPGLLQTNGQPVSGATTFGFPGLLANTQVTDATRQQAIQAAPTDIANPPFQGTNGAVGGTYVIQAGGDYLNDTGTDLIKKLIIRRLTTKKGSFFHLPDYGFGFAVKQTVNPSLLPTIQAQAQAEISKEPEVVSAVVSITASSGNTLEIFVAVVLKNYSNPITFPIPSQLLAA